MRRSDSALNVYWRIILHLLDDAERELAPEDQQGLRDLIAVRLTDARWRRLEDRP